MAQIGLNKTAQGVAFVDENGIPYGIPKDSHGHPIFSSESAIALVNSIDSDDFDLNAAAFDVSTSIANAYVFDSLELSFSTTESKTVTVTSVNSNTVIYKDTNTSQSIKLMDVNTSFKGGDNIQVEVTQFGSAGTMDCVLKTRQQSISVADGSTVTLGEGSANIGKVKLTDGITDVGVTEDNELKVTIPSVVKDTGFGSKIETHDAQMLNIAIEHLVELKLISRKLDILFHDYDVIKEIDENE